MLGRAGEEQGPAREESCCPCRDSSEQGGSALVREGGPGAAGLRVPAHTHTPPPPPPRTWCSVQPGALWRRQGHNGVQADPLSPTPMTHLMFPPPWLQHGPQDCPQVRFLASFTGTSPLKNNALRGPGQENEGRIKLT